MLALVLIISVFNSHNVHCSLGYIQLVLPALVQKKKYNSGLISLQTDAHLSAEEIIESVNQRKPLHHGGDSYMQSKIFYDK